MRFAVWHPYERRVAKAAFAAKFARASFDPYASMREWIAEQLGNRPAHLITLNTTKSLATVTFADETDAMAATLRFANGDEYRLEEC